MENGCGMVLHQSFCYAVSKISNFARSTELPGIRTTYVVAMSSVCIVRNEVKRQNTGRGKKWLERSEQRGQRNASPDAICFFALHCVAKMIRMRENRGSFYIVRAESRVQPAGPPGQVHDLWCDNPLVPLSPIHDCRLPGTLSWRLKKG